MTPEAQQAQAFFALADGLSAAATDWRVLAAVATPAVLLGLRAGVLRPAPASVRPSAPTPPGGGAPDGGLGGRTDDRAEKVGGRGEPPPKGWLVPRLVPYGPVPRRRLRAGLPPWRWERRGYITTILGAGGVGKSYVLLDLALAALEGGAWLGRDVLPVRAVLYVDTELDAEECRRRAFPLLRGRGATQPPRGLHYLHLGHSLASEEGQALVARESRKVRASLILVDSLTIGAFDVAASDQNGWNRVYTFLETLGVPVVAIDHLDKAGRGAFGSFMKQAKVRSCLQLSRLAGGAIKVEHTKSNFGPKVPTFTVLASFGDGTPGASTTFSVPPVYAGGAKPADGPGSPVAQREDAPDQTGGGDAGSSPAGGSGAAPSPLPLPPQEPPAPPSPGRVLPDALSPLLGGGDWVAPSVLVKALVGAGVCQRTAGYRLLAHLAAEGVLERQGDEGLPARAYRLPPTAQ